MRVTEFAKKLWVLRQAISEIINEKRGISLSVELRISKALDASAEIWINMQATYDLWQAKQFINLDNVEKIKKIA